MEKQIVVTPISDRIWQFNESNADGPYVDAYLICGKERALLIDSLQNLPGLYQEVRKLTSLPVDVALTHGHGDHAGVSLKEFEEAGCKIYLAPADFFFLKDRKNAPVGADGLAPLSPGQVFDLGDRKLEVLDVAGHSPGSVAFLDEENQLLFSGDSIGSGNFWMQLSSCLPLDEFLVKLEALAKRVEPLSGLKIYPGHRNQSPVQLTLQYVKDVLGLTRDILAGKEAGEEYPMNLHGTMISAREVKRGQMRSYLYDPKHLH